MSKAFIENDDSKSSNQSRKDSIINNTNDVQQESHKIVPFEDNEEDNLKCQNDNFMNINDFLKITNSNDQDLDKYIKNTSNSDVKDKRSEILSKIIENLDQNVEEKQKNLNLRNCFILFKNKTKLIEYSIEIENKNSDIYMKKSRYNKCKSDF
jgi:hypothetical protein